MTHKLVGCFPEVSATQCLFKVQKPAGKIPTYLKTDLGSNNSSFNYNTSKLFRFSCFKNNSLILIIFFSKAFQTTSAELHFVETFEKL